MKPDDEVVVLRHRGIEVLHARRYALQGPATRIYDLCIKSEPLAQYPGQHSLSAAHVGDITRMREAFGYELRHDLKPCWVAVTPVMAHSTPTHRSSRQRIAWLCRAAAITAYGGTARAAGTRAPRGAEGRLIRRDDAHP